MAKDEQVHRDLSLQFEQRKVFKEYVAITQGVLDRDSDYIEQRIGHHPHDRVKMMVTDDEDDGKEACSYYEVIERFRGYSFCRIHPRTGRTHQIRVHLASVGCPVLADKIYSGRDCLRLSDLKPGLDPRWMRCLCHVRLCTLRGCVSLILGSNELSRPRRRCRRSLNGRWRRCDSTGRDF